MITKTRTRRECLGCNQIRILWACEDICAICALEWTCKRKDLADEQILGIKENDKKLNTDDKPLVRPSIRSASELVKLYKQRKETLTDGVTDEGI